MHACVCLAQDTQRNILMPNQYITPPAFDLLPLYCVRVASLEDFKGVHAVDTAFAAGAHA